MRRTALALVLFFTACSGTAELAPLPSTTTTNPARPTPTVAQTTTTTTTTVTTTVPPTTTTTLAELQGLAYEVVAELDFPIHMVPFLPAFSLVATKDGRVWVYDGEMISNEPILDIRDQVRDAGERGLLALAVHPDDTTRVFAHYSATNGTTTVSEFSFDNGSLGGERVLLEVGQPAGNHNGGMLQFGPDGRLYLGLGDGGGANDRFGNGQNRDTLLGGITAINVDSLEATLFQYGLRNPWRFWFDDDLVYIADVGQKTYEEVSISPIEPDVNYGWPITEGLHCFRPSSGCDTAGQTLPVMEIEHSDSGTCSITGGVVYRGSAMPELRGHYFYSDYCGGYLRSFKFDAGSVSAETSWTEQTGNAGSVASFGTDSAGEMYVMTTDRILKIVPVRAG